MPSVIFYFQVHQPFRLRRYSYFAIGREHDYFDDAKNGAIFRKVAEKCYLPANEIILDLVKEHGGAFKVAYSITGVAVDQMKEYAPEVLWSFQRLAETGAVEFLGETYYHSLACVRDLDEFERQVELHAALMEELFGARPRVFRNTELIYDDSIGRKVREMGFAGALAEGADDVLGWRSPNFLYRAPGSDLVLFLKNYRLSDDIAFRFSNRGWEDFPLVAEKFAGWVHETDGNGQVVNLFMDYETFGEHQWESTGIFEFLRHMPGRILSKAGWDFRTPSEAIVAYPPAAELSFPRTVSWADMERDLTAWTGNRMQEDAIRHVYGLKEEVMSRNNPATTDLWRRLQTSDHFYYAATKWFADGDVHTYFNPYDSPYDAYINYMNVLTDFRAHVLGLSAGASKS
ncbi:MAG: alpha-amylase [Planctomycetes bacterium]|nr:alpha-amylase [Planctomycetota bacterium]